jgi:hypothetical protein
MNLVWAAPAITNPHSAYRTAADFIVKNVPDGKLVWWAAQPVVITYLYLMGKNVRVSDNITDIEEAYVVVLDYRAHLYPEYPLITAQISHMQLVFSIPNDVPVVNLVDSFDFTQLGQVVSDKNVMSIKIYSRAPMTPQLQTFAATPPETTTNVLQHVRSIVHDSVPYSNRRPSQISSSHALP